MKVLVIGASGQVGDACMRHIKGAVGTYSSRPKAGLVHLDLASPHSVREAFEAVKPTHVVLCSALTAVDFCEDNPELARKINVEGTRLVAEQCKAHQAHLTYLSTEYVFDGAAGPYSENDAPNPLNVYAKTKYEGEAMAAKAPHNLIVRTTVIYSLGHDTKNFLHVLVSKLKAGEEIQVVEDQVSTPIAADNLAEAIADLIKHDKEGLFNVTGPDLLSRFEFAKRAAIVLGLDGSLIKPVKTAAFRQRAKRPLNAGLLIDKFRYESDVKLLGVEEGVGLYKDKVKDI